MARRGNSFNTNNTHATVNRVKIVGLNKSCEKCCKEDLFFISRDCLNFFSGPVFKTRRTTVLRSVCVACIEVTEPVECLFLQIITKLTWGVDGTNRVLLPECTASIKQNILQILIKWSVPQVATVYIDVLLSDAD